SSAASRAVPPPRPPAPARLPGGRSSPRYNRGPHRPPPPCRPHSGGGRGGAGSRAATGPVAPRGEGRRPTRRKSPWVSSRLAQEPVHQPAPTVVGTRLSAVPQERGVGAAGLLQRVGQHGQAARVEGAVGRGPIVVQRPGQLAHSAAVP